MRFKVAPTPSVVRAKQLLLNTVYRSPQAPRLHAAGQDAINRVRFGPGAPRFAERLWVDPARVHHFDRQGTVWRSARVVVEAWPTANQQPIDRDPVLRTSIARWVDGLPWERTGELERMERAIERLGPVSGCRTRQDILERCERLDGLFRVIEREGRVRRQAEVEPDTFREFGGIGMHLGPDAVPIRAGNGRHRFAIARILELSVVPVRIGSVHHSAMASLDALRRPPS